MWLSKQTSDAVQILVACARADDANFVRVADAAEKIGISRQSGLKLVNALVSLGFLEAMRGRNGGVRLTLNASDIPLGRTVLQIERFLSQRTDVKSGDSALEDLFDGGVQAFADCLDQHSLAELAEGRKSLGLPAARARRRRKSCDQHVV